MTSLLIAEDEPEIREYLGLALRCEGYGVEFAENGEEVVERLQRDSLSIKVLILDLVMPRKDGFQTLAEVRRGWPTLPVITLSGSCTPANVATVLKAGAVDFLSKPIAHNDLVKAVESALEKRVEKGSAEQHREGQPIAIRDNSSGTWSETCDALLSRLGNADVPVLLRGETGVGKEVLARKLHAQSPRSAHPFLKLNCAALPSELVESELFGYERGAFTGAYKTTPGKFEMANNGTILLDEIGDMDFKLQAKLLQVLQDREFIRLGAKETQRVDVRVMAATHCNLERAIEEGRFREDLYYRLNIIEINVPPLRERRNEILGLAAVFLQKYAPGEQIEITPALQQVLLDHEWPGNVRELENVIRKYLVMQNADWVIRELRHRTMRSTSAHSQLYRQGTQVLPTLPVKPPVDQNLVRKAPAIENERPENAIPFTKTDQRLIASVAENSSRDGVEQIESPLRPSTLADLDNDRRKAETETIVAALTSTLWNRKKAAALLNIDYKALLYKMKKLGIGE
jgi:two-component system, NtrC family, response regulator AtoC